MRDRELQKRIRELKNLAHVKQIDINDDLNRISAKLTGDGPGSMDAWQRVTLARNQDRPNVLEYIGKISDSYVELHGDRLFGDDLAMVGGIAKIGGVPFTFMGHQKGRTMKENLKRNYGWAHPEGYRKALRLARQAEKFRRPILTLIDTAGAYPGIGSEERGISEAIATNLKMFSVLKTPIIAIVIGEGGSGGALGIGVGDRVFMLENSTYSVISPEGFASILLRDAKKNQLAADLMKMTAPDLLKFGIINGIIPEPPSGAHNDPDFVASRLKETIITSYQELKDKKMEQLLKERSQKLLSLGEFHDPHNGQEDSFFRKLFRFR
ncbi:acetyl-CoA carboxylase carboxyltransferase subunit alpha [Salinispira pacifica]|uniref:Acetyl-coenzyme A carboxylase carboxyl transferase subunit alpha n=1 Tax=Salinispira pacifica TaxID=1307761 RepID=V5WG53_9SPIO|nr:acetyl-CoA carboxylase carboxyltransferase subunit alpha [Salinispira pacifica]AHC14519.1 Acetyl-coenzyme A carboxyl transferase alpha chain [Salinispira pacifica]